MEQIHHDIILNIISRLPYQSIINCKLVCKPWRDLLSNTNAGLLFMLGNPISDRTLYYGGEQYCDDINIHDKAEYSYKTLLKMDICYDDQPQPLWPLLVGSCNGLVCFEIVDKKILMHDPIYICNPATREYVYLPRYIPDGADSGFFVCGFGYNYSTDEYKVVRIYYSYRSGESLDSTEVQVYTLGSVQGWRSKGNINHLLRPSASGVCANGALYWYKYGEIVAFDLADEEFRVIPIPPISEKVSGSVCLRLLRGYLSVVHFIKGGERISIHTLKKKKNCSSSTVEEPVFDHLWYWDEEFNFSYGKGDKPDLPFAVTKSNQVLMWRSGFLLYYDPQTTNLTKLWGEDWMLFTVAIPHLNTLVSLEALGERSKRRI